jgi:hypothetical protein
VSSISRVEHGLTILVMQLAKAHQTAKQLDSMDKDMRENNLRMLTSITDVSQSA